MTIHRSAGQASIEYLLVLILAVFLVVNFLDALRALTSTSFGSLGHVLTQYLTTGVCPRDCYYGRYRNGPEG